MVFSRQNLGQLLEAVVGKSTMYCDEHIRQNPENAKEIITWLNESIIKYINPEYSSRIKNEIINNLDNIEFRNSFVENIKESNLFVEAPSFAEIDIKTLLKNSIDYKEPVLIKKETIKYMKQKLKLETPFPDEDVHLENILCAPIYIQKLSKLVSKIINARDFGSVKSITKQPTKGRARGGGSRVGFFKMAASKRNLSRKISLIQGTSDHLEMKIILNQASTKAANFSC